MTFTTSPTYVFDDSVKLKTLITTYEDGTEQRHSIGSPRRTFTLRFLAVDEASRDEIHSFHQSTYGSATTFQWTHPLDSTTYSVRFIDDTLEEENIKYNDTDGSIFNITVRFIEVVSA